MYCSPCCSVYLKFRSASGAVAVFGAVGVVMEGGGAVGVMGAPGFSHGSGIKMGSFSSGNVGL